jgi:hypothetical protein
MAERRSKRWTPQEDDRFRTMAEANTRPEVIAAKLNRSIHASKARGYMIGLPLKWFKLKMKWKTTSPDFSRHLIECCGKLTSAIPQLSAVIWA